MEFLRSPGGRQDGGGVWGGSTGRKLIGNCVKIVSFTPLVTFTDGGLITHDR